MTHGLEHPLRGTRVVDLTRLLPGPFATLLLGDLGADVVKVEDPRGGDPVRWYQPMLGPMGAVFAGVGRNKRSIAVDLKHPDGAAVLAGLLATADVLMESFRPGVLARLGFPDERLRREFPRLVVCSLTGYGLTGPATAEAGHDLNFLARTGLLHATGTADGRLAIPGFQLADLAGGALYAVAGVLAALLQRERGGPAARLDLSLTDGALTFLLPGLAALQAGVAYRGPGRELLTGALPCYQVYETADGRHMALAALEPKFWEAFCDALGLAHLRNDGLATGERARAVQAELAALFRAAPQAEWAARLAHVDACCVPVRRPDEVLDDPLFLERDLFFPLAQPGAGVVRHLATPLTPADRSGFRPPPLLGEHTVEVLRELGRDDAEVAALKERKVVATA
jgi:crotonobetainyl-CoA:carnitine CoA-transferase CaiB-like acyl-CoA transferase